MLHLEIPDNFFIMIMVIEFLFVIGAISIYIICKKKTISEKSKQWLKFGTYFLIMHCMLLFTLQKCILIGATMTISVTGFVEIIRLYIRNKNNAVSKGIFVVGYLVLAICFIEFTINSNVSVFIFVYLISSVCDSFCQITGQLFGRHQLAPIISPSKTIEGALGGFLISTVIAMQFHSVLNESVIFAIVSGMIIAISSITGDLLCSWYKRMNAVKDFSSLLPGQGGVIDRFNSFIAASSMIYVFKSLMVR